ncbi:MAG: YeeE/YedE family protein [Hyphomicrobiales bacterium]|nr:YeeE/YedE family protein [Hyphomicrobiales bacterium]
MVSDSFSQAHMMFLLAGFVTSVALGAVIAATNFCTMGAISDWVNMEDKTRLRAWALAIVVTLLGVAILEPFGLVRPDAAFPPYRAQQFAWLEYILGGLMFGAGMTFASGCGSKTLVRIGGGNIKSVFVAVIIAIVAYYMVNPFPGTDKTLYSEAFYRWTNPLAITLTPQQDIGSLAGGKNNAAMVRLAVAIMAGVAALWWIFRAREFRSSKRDVFAGIAVGLIVVAAWWLTSAAAVRTDGELHYLREFVANQWEMLAPEGATKPALSRPLSPQSFSIINPLQQTLGFVASGFRFPHLTFGVTMVAGIVLGSFGWAIGTRQFRKEWFANWEDFITHVIGAVLMGIGGILALGCTFGTAITGVSTLAIGSIIGAISIVAGCYGALKFQEWRM